VTAPHRVRLTLPARDHFPDISTRHGTLLRRSGQWAIIAWDGIDAASWMPAASVEDVG
jgi:hypothetical protein